VTRYVGQVATFALFGTVAAFIFFGNAVFALRRTRNRSGERRGPVAGIADRVVLGLLLGVSAVVFLLAASAGRRHWQEVWLF
ncbi:hypothetical protein, partial [Salmonella enterica]|uniref:hypothetical protein n=1 Tax=Salmonella enterica TaxID=28901 RepID=UPI003F1A11EA